MTIDAARQPDLSSLGQYLLNFPAPLLWWEEGDGVRPLNPQGEALAARWPAVSDPNWPAIAALLEKAAKQGGADGVVSLPKDGAPAHLSLTTICADRAKGVLVLARDATFDVAMRHALIDSRQRFRDLVEISADIAWECDAAGRFVFVSGRGVAGHESVGLIGVPGASLLFDAAAEGNNPFTSDYPANGTDCWLVAPDGSTVCYEMSTLPMFDEAGARIGVRGVGRDVTEMRQRDSEAAQASARERLVAFVIDTIRGTAESRLVLARAVDVMRRAARAQGASILNVEVRSEGAPPGLSKAAAAGPLPSDEDLRQMAAGLSYDAKESRLESQGWVWLAYRTAYDGALNGMLLVGREAGPDQEEWESETFALLGAVEPHLGVVLKQAGDHERLEHQSRTDPLTGLLNRRAFMNELGTALGRAARRRRPGSLLYIDLDNFKPINDRLGHQAGDHVLIDIARMMNTRTRAYDLVARLGGDEFAIWLDEADSMIGERRANELIQAAVHLTPPGGDQSKPLGLSIGMAVYHPDTAHGVLETADGLVKRADLAMYSVKHKGKGILAIAEEPTASGR